MIYNFRNIKNPLKKKSIHLGIDWEDFSLICYEKGLIENCIKNCDHHDGSIVAIKPTDTIKFSKTNTIENTIDRNKIWLAQTPQVFDKSKLKRAISNSKISNIKATDESYLMEKMGYKINIVEGSAINLKITFRSDWLFAEHLEKNFNEQRI